jgi:hypothetical protein
MVYELERYNMGHSFQLRIIAYDSFDQVSVVKKTVAIGNLFRHAVLRFRENIQEVLNKASRVFNKKINYNLIQHYKSLVYAEKMVYSDQLKVLDCMGRGRVKLVKMYAFCYCKEGYQGRFCESTDTKYRQKNHAVRRIFEPFNLIIQNEEYFLWRDMNGNSVYKFYKYAAVLNDLFADPWIPNINQIREIGRHFLVLYYQSKQQISDGNFNVWLELIEATAAMLNTY